MLKRPMKAEDWDRCKQKYPVAVMPKIDGVRSLNTGGKLYGRSMKQHANKYTTNLFSLEGLDGFDGEMAAAEPTHPRLVNLTSSALSTIEGEPLVTWWIFDCFYDGPDEHDITGYCGFQLRYEIAKRRLNLFLRKNQQFANLLRMVPYEIANNEEEVFSLEEKYLAEGYEGVILRSLDGEYKEGRSTVNEGGFLRIKAFVVEEALVTKIIEGVVNNNEAKKNELGYRARSSHKANLVPNGQVGSIEAVDIKTGRMITIGPGKLSHKERKELLLNPSRIVGSVVKYKHFPKGVKDKPRFPTFEAFRADSDLDSLLKELAEQYLSIFGIKKC